MKESTLAKITAAATAAKRTAQNALAANPRAGAQGEIEVNDFNRRQTDTGVLMLLKTSKLMAEYAARRLRL